MDEGTKRTGGEWRGVHRPLMPCRSLDTTTYRYTSIEHHEYSLLGGVEVCSMECKGNASTVEEANDDVVNIRLWQYSPLRRYSFSRVN